MTDSWPGDIPHFWNSCCWWSVWILKALLLGFQSFTNSLPFSFFFSSWNDQSSSGKLIILWRAWSSTVSSPELFPARRPWVGMTHQPASYVIFLLVWMSKWKKHTKDKERDITREVYEWYSATPSYGPLRWIRSKASQKLFAKCISKNSLGFWFWFCYSIHGKTDSAV